MSQHSQKNKTILFVDDEPLFLDSMKWDFESEDYELLFAQDGQVAHTLLEENHVDILVVDTQMPGMSGLQLIDSIAAQYPHMIRILLSGQPHMSKQECSGIVQTLNSGGIFRFVPKSANLSQDIKTAVREAEASLDLCTRD